MNMINRKQLYTKGSHLHLMSDEQITVLLEIFVQFKFGTNDIFGKI